MNRVWTLISRKACEGLLVLPFLLFFALVPLSSHSASPSEINYQGRLLDSSGKPITTQKTVLFEFFRDSSGGVALRQTQSDVTPTNGYFTQVISVDPQWFIGGDVYVQVSVGGTAIGSRQKLLSVPYAISVGANSVGTTELIDGSVTKEKVKATDKVKIYLTVDGRLVTGASYTSATCRNSSTNLRYLDCFGACTTLTAAATCPNSDSNWIGYLLQKD